MRKRPQDMTPEEFRAAFPGCGDRWKPWSELTREERINRLGTYDKADSFETYDDYLADRLEQGLPMGLADTRRARRRLRERKLACVTA